MHPVTYKPLEVTRNKITVHWDTLEGRDAGGVGVEITQFEIRMKMNGVFKRWQTENLEFTQEGLEEEAEYVY